MATTTKTRIATAAALDERLVALESEVYAKRTDAAYFNFWNDVWIILVAMSVALLLVILIKGG